MGNNLEYDILFDLSLSMVDLGIGGVNLKSTLKKLVRTLNCSSGRIYSYVEEEDSLVFSLMQSLPRKDIASEKVLKKVFGPELAVDIDVFRAMDFPKLIEEDFVTHLFHLKGVGVLVLNRQNGPFEDRFMRTLDLVLAKLAMVLENESSREQLKEARHLASIGQIASEVVHEINNPLTTLLNSYQILESLIGDNINDDIKKYLNYIGKSSGKLHQIVKGIKSISTNQLEEPIADLSLVDVIEDSKFFIGSLINESGVLIDFPNRDQLDYVIRGRSVQLSQVFINLIKNSIEAVRFSIQSWVKIKVIAHDNSIDVYIVDSGDGIDESIQENMMKPFFTTKGKEQGTGIGLGFSRRIMAMQGGRLYYDKEAKNTTFVVTLERSKKTTT